MRGPATGRPVTCLIADDHPAILESVTRHLERAGFRVVDAVADGRAAFERARSLRPDVLVADLRMPRLDGVELAGALATAAPATAVLIYSGVADPAIARQAIDAGARGFALKDAPLDELARAIRAVAAGSLYVEPLLARAVAALSKGHSGTLSPRELAVVRLLATGDSYGEIGLKLGIAPDTARTHVQHAMKKLGARTGTQAVAEAHRHSLLG